MGILQGIFKRSTSRKASEFFGMFDAFTPVFTSMPESLYEMELVRSAIHSFAGFCSMLKPEVCGTASGHMQQQWQHRMNPIMDTSKFFYRLATILSVHNTAIILPIFSDGAAEPPRITGFYPLMPHCCEIVETGGALWLRYTFPNGKQGTIELERVGILTAHHYANDLFGESNSPMRPTLQLIHTHNEGIVTSVKNSAHLRFMARVGQFLNDDDLSKARNEFSRANLSADNKSGMMLFDAKFADVKQIENKAQTINVAQAKYISQNVLQYFGTNEAILQNSYTEEQFNAYYEGKIAPFANQLALVLTNMTFSARQIAHGNSIQLTTNRLQYVSHKTKLNLATSGFDRGLLTRNEIRAMFGLGKVNDPDADVFFIRKDYTRLDDLGVDKEGNTDGGDDNVERDPIGADDDGNAGGA